MGTEVDYDRDLQVLKKSFGGGGEGGFYFRMLERVRDRPHLDWLDIGVGRDGSALRAFVQHCRARGQSLAVTGIDPDASAREWDDDGVRWRLIRGTFQGWTPSGSFDVVNADQSLYYLEDLAFELKRAFAVLKPGGIFIATCWSREDALHRIREQLFPDARDDLVGEDLVGLLETAVELERVDVSAFRTEVRLGSWRTNPRFLEPAVRVLARSADCGDVSLRARTLTTILQDFPPVAGRVNLAVCAQKRI